MTHHVLVVDDDDAIREIVQEILEDEGYHVSTAANGREALAQVAVSPPDVVLLDLNMPVLDGWQTHARLREQQLAIPVVYMTAGQRAQHEAERHQAAGYLAKPFDLAHLLATVERFASAS